ncbi:MAG: ATP-binding protein, partial [Opitutales bacterium]
QADLARSLLAPHANQPASAMENVREALQLILSTADSAGDLVQRLLDFSDPSATPKRARVAVDKEILTATRLLALNMPRRVRLTPHLEGRDYWISAPPFSVQQLLLNLIVNAADAIGEEEGFIRVEAGPARIGPAHPLVGNGLEPGAYVALRIVDNGPGVPESLHRRIFEPFFSTKGRTDRNGLGLAMVQRIVEELDGHITFESALGIGTRFEILLPLLPLSPERADPPATVDLPGRALHSAVVNPSPAENKCVASLLFLEDDPTISQGARIILESCGFRVEHYTCGEEALAAMRAREVPFDLVLSDYHLPDMNADELITQALGFEAEQRFVLVSGSMLDDGQLGDLEEHVSRIFKKPTSYFTIAREIHLLLGNEDAPVPDLR